MTDKITKPDHNTMNGENAWDTMVNLAEANPAFDKQDAVFLALMFKHIPRAGRKSYGKNSTPLQDKILDLKKAATYLNAWIEKLEGSPVDLGEPEIRYMGFASDYMISVYEDISPDDDWVDITPGVGTILDGDAGKHPATCIPYKAGHVYIPRAFGTLDVIALESDNDINRQCLVHMYGFRNKYGRFYYRVWYEPNESFKVVRALIKKASGL